MYTMVKITTDIARGNLCDAPHLPGWEERQKAIIGQIIRIKLPPVEIDGDHIWWEVHPDDIERLTPGFGPAMVCNHIIECD